MNPGWLLTSRPRCSTCQTACPIGHKTDSALAAGAGGFTRVVAQNRVKSTAIASPFASGRTNWPRLLELRHCGRKVAGAVLVGPAPRSHASGRVAVARGALSGLAEQHVGTGGPDQHPLVRTLTAHIREGSLPGAKFNRPKPTRLLAQRAGRRNELLFHTVPRWERGCTDAEAVNLARPRGIRTSLPDASGCGFCHPAKPLEVQATPFGHLTEGAAVLVVLIQPAPADVLAHHHDQFAAVRVLPDDGAGLAVTLPNDPEDLHLRAAKAANRAGGSRRSWPTARWRRRQAFWSHVRLPFVLAAGAPHGEVDEIGPIGPRGRAKRGTGALPTRGTTESFRRVEWAGGIHSIVHGTSSTARTRPRGVGKNGEGAYSRPLRQRSKDAAGVDFRERWA